MAVANVCKLSNSTKFFAHSTPDGTLKLWNTLDGTLEQQFVPSSHLSATCTCISWSSFTCKVEKGTRKKKKKRQSSEANDQLIAMGTVSGSVLIYSIAKADLQTKLDGGHSSRVNDICWDEETTNLFSCSQDGHIVHWSLEDDSVISKWKHEDKTSIHSIALIDKNNLLSASRTILWWDISSKKVLKKFTGHATEVRTLLPVRFSDNDECEDSYFMSSAANDRIINAWKLKSDDNRTALGMFSVNEEVVAVDVSAVGSKSEPVLVFVVTKSGMLKIFEHQLNGKRKKPLSPRITLQIASESENGVRSVPIPVLSAKMIDADEFLIAHGNFLRPTFERLRYDDCNNNTCLVRKHPSLSSVSVAQDGSKIRTPDTRKGSKVLTPSHMHPMQPQEEEMASGDAKPREKRKTDADSVAQMAMEDRLNDVRFRKASGGASGDHVPQTENMAHLLTQGLQSNDSKMLDSVLNRSRETEIVNTVRKLPVQYIMPLLTELTRRMHGKTQHNHPYIKWVHNVLSNHTSYFTMNSEAVKLLQPLNDLLSNKLDVFQRMSRLSGRLDLILSQVASRQEVPQGIPTEPLLLYQEDSPEEDDDDEFMRPTHLEDSWDDLSDLENDGKLIIDDEMESSVEGSDLSDDEIDMT